MNTIVDAKSDLNLAVFAKLIMWATREDEGQDLFWRTGPDQAFAIVQHSIVVKAKVESEVKASSVPNLFSNTFCGYPLQIEWDFPEGTIDLRNKYTAVSRVINLPVPTL